MRRVEQAEQATLIRWTELAGQKDPRIMLIFHIPNGGYRTPREGAIFKRMGVKAGVPDLFLPARGEDGQPGLWIEMKAPGEKPRENQVKWAAALMEQGYVVEVAHAWEEAAMIILRYLGHTEKGWI